MYFDSFAEFIAMGTHGFYVWLAYGVGLVAMMWLVVAPVRRHRYLKATWLQRIQREQRLREYQEGQG